MDDGQYHNEYFGIGGPHEDSDDEEENSYEQSSVDTVAAIGSQFTFFPQLSSPRPQEEDLISVNDGVSVHEFSAASNMETIAHIDTKSKPMFEPQRHRTLSSSILENSTQNSVEIPCRIGRSKSFTAGVSNRNSIQSPDQLLFHAAISKRDYKRAKEMLVELPRLVKCCDEFGRTALHISCELGDVAIMDLLLQYNADVNAVDARHRACLHLCSEREAVSLLCDEGANFNIADKNGFLPLHIFTHDCNKDCVSVLLDHGADPMVIEPIHQRTSLHLAAELGDFDLIALIMLHSKVPLDPNIADVDGNTPLHLVSLNTNATGQQQRSIMMLLDKGSNVCSSNKRGITPLHFACANRYFGMNSLAEPLVQLLLEMSADPNCRDHENCTPLIISCAYREWGLCKILLEAGGDMNIPCPMNSYMLQAGFGKDLQAAGMIELQDCTASDLMQRQLRSTLFSCICAPQTKIPLDSRDRCMNCANPFEENSRGSFAIFSNGGRYHCRHCYRVLCLNCASKMLPRAMLPAYVTDYCSDSSVRLCNVCFDLYSESASS